jgi:hypothetical protein
VGILKRIVGSQNIILHIYVESYLLQAIIHIFMRPLLVLLVLISILSVASAGPCGGVITCSCGDSLISNYVMKSNLNCSSSSTALNIGSDDVIIDCNGKTISGDIATTRIGILNRGYDNITVRNCYFSGINTSIEFKGTYNNPSIYNVIYGNHFYVPENGSSYLSAVTFQYIANSTISMNEITTLSLITQ